MALSDGQKAYRPEGFGTFDAIPNVAYARNKLAIKDEWKKLIDRVVIFEVIKPYKILKEPVGTQIEGAKYLSGGGNQLQMLLKADPSIRMQYLKIIEIKAIK